MYMYTYVLTHTGILTYTRRHNIIIYITNITIITSITYFINIIITYNTNISIITELYTYMYALKSIRM